MDWGLVAGWWVLFGLTLTFREPLKRKEAQAGGPKAWQKLAVVGAIAAATVLTIGVAI